MNTKGKPTHYPPETAGRLMTNKVPIVLENVTVNDVEQLLYKEAKNFESINYIYVVDRNNKLKGAISIKELFRSPKTFPVKELLPQKIISVRTHTDQERVALLALKHSLKTVPVVDKESVLVGAIPFDSILKILDKEAVEDILRLGGIYYKGSYDDLLHLPVVQSIRHRLPWLLIGLGGGLLAASVVNSFEETLSQNLILAAFIPLIVYMADAVGTQMEAFIIRDLAVNPNFSFVKYFLKQVFAVGLIGLIISISLGIVSFLLYGNSLISVVLGIALFFAILSSVFSGLIIPYLFGKLKLDPANASGPVATIIQDVLSVLVYFLIASWLL